MDVDLIVTQLQLAVGPLQSSPERLAKAMAMMDSLIGPTELSGEPLLAPIGMLLPVLGLVTPEQLGDAETLDGWLLGLAQGLVWMRSRDAPAVRIGIGDEG